MTSSPLETQWQKHQAAQWRIGRRTGKEVSNRDEAIGELGPEDRGVRLDSPTSRSRSSDDEEPSDRDRLPTALGRDLPAEPSLPIERHERRLHVRHDRLDLHDDEHAESGMPREEVHGAALAADPEGDLGGHLPAGRAEHRGDALHKSGMLRIEQPVERLAVPVESNGEPSAQRVDHPLGDPRSDSMTTTELEASND